MNKDGVKVSILTCSVVFFICFLGLYAMKNLQKWFITVLFLTVATTLNNVLGAFVGVNIGTDVSDLPSASNIVAILKSHQINHVRLYDANPHMLQALSNTGVEAIVGVTDEEILKIGESPSVAASWISKNVAAYMPHTNITTIALGSEVLTSIPNIAPVLVPAMNHLYSALVASNLHFRVKISTPQSMDLIPKPFPPSTATFNSSWNSTVYQILQFLKNTNSSYMLNAYPYYGYTKGDGIFPIEYALLRSLPSAKKIVDPNTLFRYDSMFDAMVDATYYSIKGLNFNDIPIVVTESGWPRLGGSNEPDANVENAEAYVNNLIRRVLNDSGPPSRPEIGTNTYLYELFDEDERIGPISEKHWGLFYTTNGSSVYPLSFGGFDQIFGNSSKSFCVAKDGADAEKMEAGLDWACGQGRANCAAIQAGRPCYFPNNVKSHASYAYNDYYQKMRSVGGTCDFDDTAVITTEDPSYGSCIFAGSSNASSGGDESFSSMAFGPVGPVGASLKLQVCSLHYVLSSTSLLLALMLL
ncbi:unnamed protein product [Lathyrus oleraceus]